MNYMSRFQACVNCKFEANTRFQPIGLSSHHSKLPLYPPNEKRLAKTEREFHDANTAKSTQISELFEYKKTIGSKVIELEVSYRDVDGTNSFGKYVYSNCHMFAVFRDRSKN